MKSVLKYIVLSVFFCCLSSCGGYQKVIMKGIPGTEIYNRDGQTKLGVIGEDGKCRVKISRDGFTPYLWYRSPGAERLYPFGVNSTHNDSGLWGTYLGLFTLSFGFLADIGYWNSDQANEGWKYGKEHNIYTFTEAPYTYTTEKRQLKSKVKSATAENESSALLPKKQQTESAKLLTKDYGLQFVGTYEGGGNLMLDNQIIETYEKLKIVVTRKDKSIVEAEVFIGDESVVAPLIYKITKKGANHFVLTTDNGLSTIEINEKSMEYQNSDVKIQDEIYKLNINVILNK